MFVHSSCTTSTGIQKCLPFHARDKIQAIPPRKLNQRRDERTSGWTPLSLFWERSSLAFWSVAAPNEPRCLPPFISGGAEAGAGVAARHRSRPSAARSRSHREGGDEDEKTAAARRRRRGRRTKRADGRGCERAGAAGRPWWETAR